MATIGVCEYPNPPAGYHYEGGQPYPTCGAYLVKDATLTITTTSPLPNGQVGTAYNTSINANSGASWRIDSGSLPPGLSFNTNPGYTNYITGTPTTPGTYTFTIYATAGDYYSSKQFNLTVNPVTSALTITTTSPLPNARAGTSYSVSINTTSGANWGIDSGSLPPGLNFSTNPGYTNYITGTPTSPGTYTFGVFATAGDYHTSKQFSLNVVATTSTSVCEYANPPAGYHYEGGQPYPTCGAYLVKDATSALTITKNLGLGSRNNDVITLQQKLQNLGYFPQSVQPTGYFGSITRTSVIRFQKANGILTTGFVGPLTRNALAQ